MLLFVFRFEQRRLIFLRAVLPIIVGYSLVTVASVSYRGAPGQTLAWLTLFPHVAHLFRAQDLVAPTEAARAVEVLLEDYRRELGAKLTSEERARYSMDNFVRIYTAMQIELRKFGAVSSEEVSPYFREFALSTISNHPFAYVSHVKDHAFTAWRIHFPYAANTESWLNEHFQLLEKTHNERARKLATRFYIPEFEYAQLTSGHYRTLKRDSSIIDGTLRLLVRMPLFGPVIAITSAIVLLASLLWGRRLLWLAVAGYVGAMMHGAMLLTAFATTVIPRYVDPIVPLGIVFLVIILDRLLAVSARNVAGRLGRKGNPAPLVTAP